MNIYKDLHVPLDHTQGGIQLNLVNRLWPAHEVIHWEGGMWLDVWEAGKQPNNCADYMQYLCDCKEYLVTSIPNEGEDDTVCFFYPYDMQKLKQGKYVGLLRNGCDVSLCRIIYKVGQDLCFAEPTIYEECSDDILKSPMCQTQCLTECCEEAVHVCYHMTTQEDGTEIFTRIEVPRCGCKKPKIDRCDPCHEERYAD